MRALVKTHILRRAAGWPCDCGDPWPCEHRRAKFLADFADRLDDLRPWMADYRDKFLADHPDADLREAEERFRGWIPEDQP